MKRWLMLWISLFVVACSSAPRVPAVRFANRPAVRAVNDRLDVPKQPHERGFLHDVYHYDGIVQRRLERALELPPDRRALGVNALDEVPDSTWFTNRIGVRDLSPAEIAAGPTRIDSPELHKPWTVKSTKEGGSELGFIITDARGEKFLLKFDPLGYPEQETATHVVVDRLLWACGYNTTEDFVVEVKRDELILAPDAYIKDDTGAKTKLDRAAFDSRLAKVDPDRDGTIRALASRWLPGKPLGGHPAEGVRGDDPNDRIPHELRRDLRGLYTIAAWLDHVDIQESNFLDMWVEDPGNPHHHYVKHFMLDFGKSMGVMATTGGDPRRGFNYVVDIADMTKSLITGGTFERAWERRDAPALRGVGLFDAESFDPGSWSQDSPAYVPFLDADRYDKFWAAKIVMRFTRAQIRAAVDAGRYSDPRAAEYVTNTLIARQRATGAYWFRRVNPLDRFAVANGSLCFEDLMLSYRLGSSVANTTYTVTAYDRGAHPLSAPVVVRPDDRGHACTGALPLGQGTDAYTIVELATQRPDFSGRTLVHVARDRISGELRVIGVWRP